MKGGVGKFQPQIRRFKLQHIVHGFNETETYKLKMCFFVALDQIKEPKNSSLRLCCVLYNFNYF